MRQLGWPRAPFLVGFVLTRPTEQCLWMSISRYDMEWLLRPGGIVQALLFLGSIIWIYRDRRKGKEVSAEKADEGAVRLVKLPSILFTLFVLLVVTGALQEASWFLFLGAIFSMAATIPAIFKAVDQLLAICAPGARRRESRRVRKTLRPSVISFRLSYFFRSSGFWVSALPPPFSHLAFSTAG